MKGILGLVVLLAVGWLVMKARDQFWKGASRHVLARSQHTESQQLTLEQLVIRSSVAPDALQDAIVRGLALPYEKPSGMHAELFQGPVRTGHVQFGSGTKLATQFVTAMRITPAGGGSTLTYRVEKWVLADGIVTGITQLKYLRRHVEDEARKVDPQIAVAVEPAPERVQR